MENSVTNFSGRNLREDVRETLTKYGNGIDKLVTFGLQLIEWDFERDDVEKKDGYLVPILFLRNLIENIDAISILVRHGSSDPSKSLLRTVLENFFSLEYLIGEKGHERSMSFLVWNTYHNVKYYEKLDGTSERAKNLQALLRKDKFLYQSSPLVFDKADELKANAKQLLALDLYVEFAKEFERTKQKVKNPYWYSLHDGPRDVEGLANLSKFPALYEVYRGLSNSVHGTDVIQGKLSSMGDGRIGIPQLRLPTEAQMITQYSHNLCVAAYATYVSVRVPAKKDEYANWLQAIQPLRDALAKGVHITVT